MNQNNIFALHLCNIKLSNTSFCCDGAVLALPIVMIPIERIYLNVLVLLQITYFYVHDKGNMCTISTVHFNV